jgi:hypothetical protein
MCCDLRDTEFMHRKHITKHNHILKPPELPIPSKSRNICPFFNSNMLTLILKRLNLLTHPLAKLLHLFLQFQSPTVLCNLLTLPYSNFVFKKPAPDIRRHPLFCRLCSTILHSFPTKC